MHLKTVLAVVALTTSVVTGAPVSPAAELGSRGESGTALYSYIVADSEAEEQEKRGETGTALYSYIVVDTEVEEQK
ncbi:hypothetical protein PVAG01_11153 [Phlyctema vagabunda]|uniref:Uncharacterized protein n=1 Tax=Phlyctema vagabunda TaxID=108571 RepID=A0ABR4P1H9_9HELO